MLPARDTQRPAGVLYLDAKIKIISQIYNESEQPLARLSLYALPIYEPERYSTNSISPLKASREPLPAYEYEEPLPAFTNTSP